MIHLFAILLSLFLVMTAWSAPSALAASQPAIPSASSKIVEPSVVDLMQDLDALYQKALDATNQGDFAIGNVLDANAGAVPQNPAVWSNRGNARVSQNKLEGAIADYNKSIELAPDAPDPYLNRGGAGRCRQVGSGVADYNHVLELDPKIH